MATFVAETHNDTMTIDSRAMSSIETTTVAPSENNNNEVDPLIATDTATSTASKRPAWNFPSAPNTTGDGKDDLTNSSQSLPKKKPTLADIMAEQTQDRMAAQIASGGIDVNLAEMQAEQERLFRSLQGDAVENEEKVLQNAGDLSAEELRMIEQAMQESLQMASPAPPAAATSAALNTDGQLSEQEMEEIEKAIREADHQEQSNDRHMDMKPAASSSHDETSAAASTETAPSGNLSADEAAAIEAAIKEADAKAEAESLRLALQIQQEEIRLVKQRNDEYRQAQQFGKGNVRTMTKAELQAEADRLHAGFEPALVQHVDEEYEEEDNGFKMNPAIPSSQWNRRDRHTIVGPNDEVRTKHDVHVQGQSNAQILALDTDDYGVRAHVGNQAFNSFKKTMKRTTKGVATHGTGRAGTDTDATKGKAMDSQVRLIIAGAINSELILRCNGAVKQGKEAIVYHADKGEGSLCHGFDVAVKVFKRIKEFRSRGEYVDGDPRYAGRPYRSMSSREQVESWTEKEYRNLVRAHRAKIPVPTPLEYKQNVLFMRFMGNDGWPAPQIREIDLRKGSRKWDILYTQVMESIRRLHRDARLVHGDLSEYNILIAPVPQVDHPINPEEGDVQTVLIDFGQSVDTRHPEAMELLERDILRVNEFFSKQGVPTMGTEEAKEFVTTDNAPNCEKLQKIEGSFP
ncbi:serine/threonine kinase [Nitzschia inconspicua]|uniref:non-specific serine/threonine protein kinase n=1 Tax=Nitzschia inconspicua TaxID=303405 RepID=A0A9K3L312_9STRA|nr:serine/threonine kinase [Nitzschia inconspicua]